MAWAKLTRRHIFARLGTASGTHQSADYLRWGSEMNGPWTKYGKDPKQYVEKFRLVTKVMREEAPNVAMVWTPFCRARRAHRSYYPATITSTGWVSTCIAFMSTRRSAASGWQRDPWISALCLRHLCGAQAGAHFRVSRPRCTAKALHSTHRLRHREDQTFSIGRSQTVPARQVGELLLP
jgi:hypothetical protein